MQRRTFSAPPDPQWQAMMEWCPGLAAPPREAQPPRSVAPERVAGQVPLGARQAVAELRTRGLGANPDGRRTNLPARLAERAAGAGENRRPSRRRPARDRR